MFWSIRQDNNTGDKDLLDLGVFEDIKIVKADQFLIISISGLFA